MGCHTILSDIGLLGYDIDDAIDRDIKEILLQGGGLNHFIFVVLLLEAQGPTHLHSANTVGLSLAASLAGEKVLH